MINPEDVHVLPNWSTRMDYEVMTPDSTTATQQLTGRYSREAENGPNPRLPR